MRISEILLWCVSLGRRWWRTSRVASTVCAKGQVPRALHFGCEFASNTMNRLALDSACTKWISRCRWHYNRPANWQSSDGPCTLCIHFHFQLVVRTARPQRRNTLCPVVGRRPVLLTMWPTPRRDCCSSQCSALVRRRYVPSSGSPSRRHRKSTVQAEISTKGAATKGHSVRGNTKKKFF